MRHSRRADARTTLDPLVEKVVRSLEFAICNSECEMERPSEWIGHDPDLRWRCQRDSDPVAAVLRDQQKRDYPADG